MRRSARPRYIARRESGTVRTRIVIGFTNICVGFYQPGFGPVYQCFAASLCVSAVIGEQKQFNAETQRDAEETRKRRNAASRDF